MSLKDRQGPFVCPKFLHNYLVKAGIDFFK